MLFRPFAKYSIFAALICASPMYVAPAAVSAQANPDALITDMLDIHNAQRAVQGVEALQWDSGLARDAQNWANNMAQKNFFEHAPQHDPKKRQGENLSMGWGKGWDALSLAQMWVDEKTMVRSGRFPDVGHNVHWSKVGHYTQMIWPTTTHVGCALAKGVGGQYLVCRYSPAGNRIGTAFVYKADNPG